MKDRQAIRVWTLVVGMTLILVGAASSQQPASPTNNPRPGRTTVPLVLPPVDPHQPPDLPPDFAERQAKMLNSNRQKQLVLDTERLVTLANELKIAVDKSTRDTLSLDVIRKADEIEKLAHSVKEKMKGN